MLVANKPQARLGSLSVTPGAGSTATLNFDVNLIYRSAQGFERRKTAKCVALLGRADYGWSVRSVRVIEAP